MSREEGADATIASALASSLAMIQGSLPDLASVVDSPCGPESRRIRQQHPACGYVPLGRLACPPRCMRSVASVDEAGSCERYARASPIPMLLSVAWPDKSIAWIYEWNARCILNPEPDDEANHLEAHRRAN